MAPIKDETVDALRDLVHKLESRIDQLEAKLHSAGGDVPARKPASSSEQIRMILMGPPGAGMFHSIKLVLTVDLHLPGKGTQAPKIKEKYCACHLVCIASLHR